MSKSNKRPKFPKAPSRRPKYGNRETVICGEKFDSAKEGRRYLYLLDAQKRGIISYLQRQVRFELIPSVTEEYVVHLKTKDKVKTRTVQLPITYTCDFQYIKDGELVVEDVKPSPKILPKEFQLKKKMMLALKGIKVKMVYDAAEPI